MKPLSFLSAFLFSVVLGSFVTASAAPDQGRDIEILEQVYFTIERMPSARNDGRITLYKDPGEAQGVCKDCEIRLRFSADLPIKISGETSTMSLEQLSVLPRQRVSAELQGDRLLSIGMIEVERGTRYRKDI